MPEATQPTAPSSSSAPSPSAPAAASAPATSSAPSNPTTAAPAASPPASPAPAAAPAQPVARPGYVPEQHWDAAAGKIKDEKAYADAINGALAFQAAEQSRKLTIPAPDKYEPALPADFQPPAGLEFKIDASDPLIAQYRTLAHEFGLDQAQFSKGLGLLAAVRVGEAAQIKAAYDAEVAKLGATGTQRVDAVIQWINAVGGAEAKALGDALKIAPVAATVTAFENLMKRFQTQGAASFSTAHQAPPPSKPDDKTYQGWTFQQRMNFARTGDPNNSSLQS